MLKICFGSSTKFFKLDEREEVPQPMWRICGEGEVEREDWIDERNGVAVAGRSQSNGEGFLAKRVSQYDLSPKDGAAMMHRSSGDRKSVV